MLQSSLISLLGWMSAGRIFSKWSDSKMISKKNFFYVQLTLLLFSFLPLLGPWKIVFQLIFFAVLFIIGWVAPKIIEWRRQQEFMTNVISAMDALLLSLRAGRSFRDSLTEILQGEINYGHFLREILSLILLRQNFDLKNTHRQLKRVYLELKMADQSTHRIADRIKTFRYQLKIEENFRQKSRIATLQARAQSMVVGFLYILTLIFDFLNFSKNLDIRWVLTSALLFLAGTIWIWKLGRTHQWKV